MTTSGTSTFNLDLQEMVEEAYERAGIEMRTGYDPVSYTHLTLPTNREV